MDKSADGASIAFKCSKCQQAWFVNGGSVSCIVLKALWPKMDENSKMFREEYLPEWRRSNEYQAVLLFEAGAIGEGRKEEIFREVAAMWDKWHQEHPLPRPWWKFWESESSGCQDG